MSKFSSNSNDSKNTGIGHYPNKIIIEHLKICQKITADYSRDMFDSFHIALQEKLSEFVDVANSNQESRQLQETIRLLHHNSAQLNHRFIGYLNEGFVKFKGKRLNTHTGEDKYSGDTLSLVNNADLEETIALSSIVHRADEQFSEELWFLNQRLAVLNGGEKVREHNNPVSPVQFCESLRKSLSIVSLSTKAKVIAYKVFEGELTEHLGGIFKDVNRYLANQDILPNLHISLANSWRPGSPDSHRGEMPSGKFEEATGQAAENRSYNSQPAPGTNEALPEQNQDGLIRAIRTLQHHIAGTGVAPTGQATEPGPSNSPAPGASPGDASGQRRVYSNQQLVSTLRGLQTEALKKTAGAANTSTSQSGAIPSAGVVGQRLADQLKEAGEDGDIDRTDMHTIDLVGMLFEYMLSDEHLPDSVKAILSYLHTPFLKMAFIDSTFFEKAEHPARLLLNSLAEAGTRWVSNDGTSQYEIYSKIKETVSRVLEDYENDVRLFAELLLEFSSYVKKIARRQDLMEKRAMEKVQGEETLREVKVRVNKEIRSRTDGKELPSAVLLLLLQPWSDYLAFLLLRYGDKSESWQKALVTVDDTLWSIEAKQDNKDKARQLDILDELLNAVEKGFETIGYDQSKGKKLIEALVSLQKMAMQSRAPAPAPAPMRDKLESEASEKAGGADEPVQKPTPEEAKMVDNLKMVEFGTWFEFDGGKRLKVAWYNSKTMHYMLVDQMGKKVAMKSGLEMARGMLSGNARVIAGSTKPFFDRALENILQNLNAKAESIQPETSDV